MPRYLFVTDDEEERFVEEFFHMAEAPELGSVIEINGVRCRRIPSLPIGVVQKDRHFASVSLPQHYLYHRGQFAPNGDCLFTSMKQVRETVACARDNGEDLSYE